MVVISVRETIKTNWLQIYMQQIRDYILNRLSTPIKFALFFKQLNWVTYSSMYHRRWYRKLHCSGKSSSPFPLGDDRTFWELSPIQNKGKVEVQQCFFSSILFAIRRNVPQPVFLKTFIACDATAISLNFQRHAYALFCETTVTIIMILGQ